MELDGFGNSLVGRSVVVSASGEKAWLPWEFLAASYTCRILVCGDVKKTVLAYTQTWTAVFGAGDMKVWSAIATVLRGLGPTVLLVFDADAPEPPTSFIRFLDENVSGGRMVITRVWMGDKVAVVVPDAVFFATGDGLRAYDYLTKMPARNGHGAWNGMSAEEFKNLYDTVTANTLGLVISDLGEAGWTLFWHREADSAVSVVSSKALVSSLLHAAAVLVHTIT